MPKTQNFSEHLEQSLERIGHKVGERMERVETKGSSDHEVVKESIRSIAQEVAPTHPLPAPAVSVTQGDDEDNGHLPSYIVKAGIDTVAKRKIEQLVRMAFNKSNGLEKAIREAKKQPFFIEDAFHDALVDKALPELRKRGILKKL